MIFTQLYSNILSSYRHSFSAENPLTSWSQIKEYGLHRGIGAISEILATESGITNNSGDYTALVVASNSNWNGDGIIHYGQIFLFSPRLGGAFYSVRIWNTVANTQIFGQFL